MDTQVAPMLDVTLDSIREAREKIQPYIKRTPLRANETLSRRLGVNVLLKLELFQKTGSFKVRGAFNKLLSSPEIRHKRGVVAVSGGNHAQAVAYASRALGFKAIIVMPRSTPSNYVDATRGYGAEVDFAADAREAFDRVALYEQEGWLAVHPFDDPLVIAGQGTTGLEILEDVPHVTDVVVSIGGGGFIAGIATALKSLKPNVRIWGVETVGADAMSRAFEAGGPVELAAITSIAKTLGAPSVSARTFAYARHYLEEVLLVSDRDAMTAVEYLLERAKILSEPAAACTLAAAEQIRARFDGNANVVLVLCGGNLGIQDLCKLRGSF
jgi:threonine dehydratase